MLDPAWWVSQADIAVAPSGISIGRSHRTPGLYRSEGLLGQSLDLVFREALIYFSTQAKAGARFPDFFGFWFLPA